MKLSTTLGILFTFANEAGAYSSVVKMKASRKLHSSLAASRRGFFGCAGAVTTSALLQVRPISAADVVEAPRDWGLAGKDYATESLKVIGHMRYCINQEKGAPNMGTYAQPLSRGSFAISSNCSLFPDDSTVVNLRTLQQEYEERNDRF